MSNVLVQIACYAKTGAKLVDTVAGRNSTTGSILLREYFETILMLTEVDNNEIEKFFDSISSRSDDRSVSRK